MPSQFSLTDILAYVGSGLLFLVVIALVYPNLDVYEQVRKLSTASGILAIFALYICGYLIASVLDLIDLLTHNPKGHLFPPFSWLLPFLSLEWIPKTSSSTAMRQIEDRIDRLETKYREALPPHHGWDDDEVGASLETIATSPEAGEYVARLSSLQTFVCTSALVCIVGIVLSAIQLISGAYKDLPHLQWLCLWFSIGLVLLLTENRFLLIEQRRQMWKQACKVLVESGRIVKPN